MVKLLINQGLNHVQFIDEKNIYTDKTFDKVNYISSNFTNNLPKLIKYFNESKMPDPIISFHNKSALFWSLDFGIDFICRIKW